MPYKPPAERTPEEIQKSRLIWIIVISALLIIGAASGRSDKTSDSSESSCEIAWSNSVEKETGGSRSYYTKRCEEGMENLRKATEETP